jgi:hypothetical protein
LEHLAGDSTITSRIAIRFVSILLSNLCYFHGYSRIFSLLIVDGYKRALLQQQQQHGYKLDEGPATTTGSYAQLQKDEFWITRSAEQRSYYPI